MGGACKWDMHHMISPSDDWPETVTIHRNRKVRKYSPAISCTAIVTTDGIIGHANCSNCGKLIDPWDSYCKHCGAKIEHKSKERG